MIGLAFQPVRVAINDDHEARLVFVQDRLVGVLVQLSESHGAREGAWFLEAGFGVLASSNPPVFPTLEAAGDWVLERLQAGR